MTKNQKTYLVLGVGAVLLFLWYRSRSTGGSLFGSLLGGQGTAGAGTLNTSFSGSPGATGSGAGGGSSTIDENERIRLRNLATGAASRGACLFPTCRWIDTSTAPYYGLGVTQANFDKWLRTANWTSSGQPSLAYVQQVLSRP